MVGVSGEALELIDGILCGRSEDGNGACAGDRGGGGVCAGYGNRGGGVSERGVKQGGEGVDADDDEGGGIGCVRGVGGIRHVECCKGEGFCDFY